MLVLLFSNSNQFHTLSARHRTVDRIKLILKHDYIILSGIVTRQVLNFSIYREAYYKFCQYDHEMSLQRVKKMIKDQDSYT